MHADPDAIKRAIANLVDNAAEAMQGAMVKEIVISTAVAGERDSVEIAVSDTGHGVTPAVKVKLFLPYFSTKKRGTGLGLADRRPHHRRPSRLDTRRGECSHRYAVYRRVTCGGCDDGGVVRTTCTPF